MFHDFAEKKESLHFYSLKESMSLPRFFITTRRYTVRLLSHPLLPCLFAIAAMLITLSSLKPDIQR